MHIGVHMYTLILSKTVVGHFPERRKLFGQGVGKVYFTGESVHFLSVNCPGVGKYSENVSIWKPQNSGFVPGVRTIHGQKMYTFPCEVHFPYPLSEKFPPFRKVADHCF